MGMKYYSSRSGGFYDSEINKVIPSDAIEISDDLHMRLLAGQSEGKIIVCNGGVPQLDVPPSPSLLDAQAAKRMEINAGFDAAMTASMTMPSASTPPSAFAVYRAIETWKADDPDGFNALVAIHTERRDTMLAAVDVATTPEAVQAISVSYAV